MKVSHEVLSCLFQESRGFNDFDYALAHLVLENQNYADFYKEQSSLGREVWLDNSIFEKGKSLDIEDILVAKGKINPTHVVVPDVLKDKKKTIRNYIKYNKYLKDVNRVAVVQGATEKDMIECYLFFESLIGTIDSPDIIAIPFDIDIYDKYLSKNKNRFVLARQKFIMTLIAKGIVNKTIPHHLLGCIDPIEFIEYRMFPFITSVDTSCPITHGYYKQKITKKGLTGEKPSVLLADIIDKKIDKKQRRTILQNTKTFKYFL